ncbi:uncharacterized protein ACA1_342900 [Acanthamoeba castellanii str. Neff]|uniref:Uncharacterized protein n=1 Tax=Acanthamoeba castellanii (strain ATCC 30010 / Neff) TaxID=1257118 RepID=L8HFG8_ACACF|nr:uncharacterized protein ACA1_342900 [Acanthamoeba castellanii str. Neff]ELR23156.1 hypothetical protein ACA1_342900 [Acanthamoeba castellanii str. Neff]
MGKTCLVGVIDTRIRDHPNLKDKVVIHRDYVGNNIVDHTKWNPHSMHNAVDNGVLVVAVVGNKGDCNLATEELALSKSPPALMT